MNKIVFIWSDEFLIRLHEDTPDVELDDGLMKVSKSECETVSFTLDFKVEYLQAYLTF